MDDVKAIGGTWDEEGFAGSDMWPLAVSLFSVLRPFMSGSCVVILGSVSCGTESETNRWAQVAF